ncbi:MAG: hypothetical protein C0391_03785 [Anaerolinea sp.]|nr:hypothetical protein [Anaerolinea sp.]
MRRSVTMQEDIVEKIKAKLRIEQIVEQDGFPLVNHGRYRKATQHDSLVIDVEEQGYFWNSSGEHGDVINWVQKRRGLDFKSACEELCRRGGFPAPEWGKQDAQVRIAVRAREDAFDVAARVFEKWLWSTPMAIEYARSRGWTEEIIKAARLGYSGSGSAEERKDLTGELSMAGVDLKGPAAIAILGYTGDVKAWSNAHEVKPHDNWVERGSIPGLLGQRSLVYPHVRGGKVKYMSLRGIEEKRHYNLPKELVGDRQPYFNHLFSADQSTVVVVEGQADAISLAQWGVAAVALAGTSIGEGLITQLKVEGRHIYLGLDADKAGKAGGWKNARLLGPMTRVIHWPGDNVKDANDLLKRLTNEGADVEQQARAVILILENSSTFAEDICTWAGEMKGNARDAALKDAFEVVMQMPEFERATYQGDLSRVMKVNQREFSRIIKTMLNETKKAERTGETTFTLGGVIDGWLVEYLYDPEDHTSSLAWRDPEGKLGSGRTVEINHEVYEALPATETFRMGGVLFPSKIGEPKPTGEMVKYVELFIKHSYLMAQDLDTKIMSYYVLLTWIYDSFNTIPYLRAMGEAGAGKSELMRRVGLICYRTISANGCGTIATLFRSVERYQGTVFIDEADLQVSDTTSEIVKFLNLGAMKGNPITRLEEIRDEEGKKSYEEKMYRTFCPKLIAMRRDYKDDAVGSRCLTFKIQPRETFELIKYHIPLEINNDMRASALAIRNLLLRWKMDHWQAEIPVDPTFYDLDISSRLNQVTGPLMAVAKDDPALQKEMRQFLREYYAEMIQTKSMTITARVIEAIWQIHKFPDLRKQYVVVAEDGVEKMMVGSVTTIANQIMDTMNAGDDKKEEEEHTKRKKDELSPQRIGRLLREELQIKIGERTRLGFWMLWDEDRMTALAKRYGLNIDQIGPTATDSNLFKSAGKTADQTPTQTSLIEGV